MAIIDKDTRMTVATRLANLNYKEQMDSSLAKLKPNLKEALKHDKEEE